VVIQIAGGPDDIKVAQYLMQKILKGNRWEHSRRERFWLK
jgi:hypothetical protein